MLHQAPDFCSPGARSFLVSHHLSRQPFEPKPIRVRNIFICAGVVFCASSSMINALSSVRPLMYARWSHLNKAFSMLRWKLSAPNYLIKSIVQRSQIWVNLALRSPGRKAKASRPASIAGRVRIIRPTCSFLKSCYSQLPWQDRSFLFRQDPCQTQSSFS